MARKTLSGRADPFKERQRAPSGMYRIEKSVRQAGMSDREKAWLDYLIPGSPYPGTLRNKLGKKPRSYGIVDPRILERAETNLAGIGMLELVQEPIKGSFDFKHYSEIHRRLFGDAYEWAGEPRRCGLVKSGFAYGDPEDVIPGWEAAHQRMANGGFLKGVSNTEELAFHLADHWGEVNYVHAFREGNTRSQAVFFQQMVKEAGWELSVARLAPGHPESVREEFVTGRFLYQQDINEGRRPDPRPLAEALTPALIRMREPVRKLVLPHPTAPSASPGGDREGPDIDR